MNEYLGRLPSGKYNLVGTSLVLADGVPYALANVSEEGLLIKIDSHCINVAECKLALYRDSISHGVPVFLEGVSETIQSILAESERREGLVKDLISLIGIPEKRNKVV